MTDKSTIFTARVNCMQEEIVPGGVVNTQPVRVPAESE
jgi:hypothetical protein